MIIISMYSAPQNNHLECNSSIPHTTLCVYGVYISKPRHAPLGKKYKKEPTTID